LLSSSASHHYLHSFPTRRSSDLLGEVERYHRTSINKHLKCIRCRHPGYVIRLPCDIFLCSHPVLFKGHRSPCLRQPEREEITFRSEEHTSELQSRFDLVCRLLLE